MAGFMYGIMSGKRITECQEIGAKIAAHVVSIFNPWEKGSEKDGN